MPYSARRALGNLIFIFDSLFKFCDAELKSGDFLNDPTLEGEVSLTFLLGIGCDELGVVFVELPFAHSLPSATTASWPSACAAIRSSDFFSTASLIGLLITFSFISSFSVGV